MRYLIYRKGAICLDNENLNNIPDEEIKEEITEAVEETEETADEAVSDEEATGEEAVTDSDAEASEDSEEVDEEDEYEERICPGCKNDTVARGHEYCRKCERKYVKTRIGFFRYVAGLAALLGSLVAFIIVCISALPSLQVFEGHIYEAGNIVYSAIESFRKADEVASNVQSSLSGVPFAERFLRTGSGLDNKIFKASVKFYNPLVAEQYKQYIFDSAGAEEYQKHSRAVKENTVIYKKYEDMYKKVEKIYDKIVNTEKTTPEDGKPAIAEIEKLRGQKGVDEQLLNLYCYDIAGMCEMGEDTVFGYLDKTYESRSKSDVDWGFLYLDAYVNSLIKRDRDDEAKGIIDELMKRDLSDEKPVKQLARIYLKQNELDKAEIEINNYCANNLTVDNAFSDTGYQLLIWLARVRGDYDEVKETVDAASQLYELIPDYNRQLALAYLAQGKYDDAFEQAYLADEKAYYRMSYYNDPSAMTEEIYATLYVSAFLADKYGKKDTENAENIKDIIDSFKDRKFTSDTVSQIIEGKLDVKDAVTKGVCDLI